MSSLTAVLRTAKKDVITNDARRSRNELDIPCIPRLSALAAAPASGLAYAKVGRYEKCGDAITNKSTEPSSKQCAEYKGEDRGAQSYAAVTEIDNPSLQRPGPTMSRLQTFVHISWKSSLEQLQNHTDPRI